MRRKARSLFNRCGFATAPMRRIVYPPLPAFYHHPRSIEEMVDHTVARILKLMDIEVPGPEWQGASYSPAGS